MAMVAKTAPYPRESWRARLSIAGILPRHGDFRRSEPSMASLRRDWHKFAGFGGLDCSTIKEKEKHEDSNDPNFIDFIVGVNSGRAGSSGEETRRRRRWRESSPEGARVH